MSEIQPSPPKASTRSGVTPSQLREVLAATLCGQTQPEFVEGDVLLEQWQNDPQLRHEYRERAAALLLSLAAIGVNLRSSDSKKVEKRLEYLKTIPPRIAYTEDETTHLEDKVVDPDIQES